MDSRTRTTLSLILIWANVGPRILIVCNFLNFFKLLFVVGLVWPSRPTLFEKTMLDGVLLVWTGLNFYMGSYCSAGRLSQNAVSPALTQT